MFISMDYCFVIILTLALYCNCNSTSGLSTEDANKFDSNSTNINETTEIVKPIFKRFRDQLVNVGVPLISGFQKITRTRNSTNGKPSNGIEKILKSDGIEQVPNVNSTPMDGFVLHNSTNINILVDELVNAVQRTSDSIDNEACKSDTQVYARDLKAGQSWAMKMFDSTGKVPDSLLTGNTFLMGNYDECVEIEGVKSNFGEFRGQYCVLDVVPKQLNTLLYKNTHGKENISTDDSLAAMLSLKWSICIPSTCRLEDIEVFLQSMPPLLSDVTVKVNELGCRTSEKKPFRPVDWLAIGVLSLIGILALLSTTYDLVSENSLGNHDNLLRSFSVYTNGSKLLNSTPIANNLPALHGIRVLSMLGVIVVHTTLVVPAQIPSVNNIVFLNYIHSDWGHLIVTSSHFSVDSFFLLSGFLISYLLLGSLDSGKPFNVPAMYLSRYVRLTPPLAVMVLLTATLFNYAGDGPQWEKVQGGLSSQCDTNWWATLIYINNYYQYNICLGTTWYLSADTQLFWISPLIMYPLWRWPKFGKCLLTVAMALGCLVPFLISYLNDIPLLLGTTGATLNDSAKKLYYLETLYRPTHVRFTPWLIGIGLGYVLHHSKHTTVRLNKWVVTLGWLSSAILMLLPCISGHYTEQPGYVRNRILEYVWSGLARPAWALGLAWVIVACAKGYGGFVNTFLSWSFFQVLSRFSYCVYLTHFSVLVWYNGSLKHPKYLDDNLFAMEFFGVTAISIAAAFVLILFVETPFIFLGKYIIEKCYPSLNRQAKSKIRNED